MEIYSCGFYFPEESGVNDFRTSGCFFYVYHTWKFFPRAKSPRPVRLAGVKGLLRVGGRVCSKGGGEGLFNGGRRVPWLAEVSFPPPPFKRTKGGGVFVKGGRGVLLLKGGGGLLKGGGGVVEKGRRRGLLKTCIWGGGAAPSPPNPPSSFFDF